jgi:hypothetical protein
MSQIHPAVRSLNPTAFCAVVPLYCAALTEAEAKYPPYYTDRKGRVSIRGAPLCCGDPYTDASSIMPWDEVSEEEQKGGSHVPLDIFTGSFNTNLTEDPLAFFTRLLSTSLDLLPALNSTPKSWRGRIQKSGIVIGASSFRVSARDCNQMRTNCCVSRSLLDLPSGKAGISRTRLTTFPPFSHLSPIFQKERI